MTITQTRNQKFYGLEIYAYYHLLNGDVVQVFKLDKHSNWGIFCRFITGRNIGGVNVWNSNEYPFFVDETQDNRLTVNKVTKEENPEYFL